ncbi:MAG TPA: ThuA domain-containing protein [Anaerohalosphaeraceae bacterium]|nr:ThuA domain-containing protein [Anaerohalosphaeraceae bacterium]HOL31982.1 ThuA domain-containing protein [Anaerohalosphaeraceae bacterium]HOM76416.1 ThuA domain-containing protein [Anaerohalosphaeraceae bacterium]HPC63662.1 ThuA domain-containing protein [Anaerohalosphaeraceae bacterium]HPO69403.1 ThuA domain-containing protein [Anaerohalosphaeraceae bacterium]
MRTKHALQFCRLLGLLGAVLTAGISCVSPQHASAPGRAEPLDILVLTGGHGFEQQPFYEMFSAMEGLRTAFAELDQQSRYWETLQAGDADVIVMYHMRQQITDKAKANLLALCEKGTGFVVLHHSICAYNDWDAYRKLVGAAYLHQPRTIDGTVVEPGTYKHDVAVPVHIAASHPVTAGLADFELFDEGYKGCWFEPDNTVLLTTTQPASDPVIGWVRTFRNSRVCTLQSGHGKDTFDNPAYRRLVQQAIVWAAGR